MWLENLEIKHFKPVLYLDYTLDKKWNRRKRKRKKKLPFLSSHSCTIVSSVVFRHKIEITMLVCSEAFCHSNLHSTTFYKIYNNIWEFFAKYRKFFVSQRTRSRTVVPKLLDLLYPLHLPFIHRGPPASKVQPIISKMINYNTFIYKKIMYCGQNEAFCLLLLNVFYVAFLWG